jgi:hypothetical protein
MIAKTNQESSFAIVGERRRDLPDLLKRAFEHPWVASYQVGFGPPLVRSSDRIIHRVKESRTALEKLRAYLDVCILDEEERKRLAALHRKLLVRQHGPIEAEALDAASATALDLTLRLHIPERAPPKARGSMEQAGVDFGLIPVDTPPEILSGRFLVRLTDPFNTRLLHMRQIQELVSDPEQAVALELRVPVALRPFYGLWLEELAKGSEYGFIDLEDPVAHARISRNGERS